MKKWQVVKTQGQPAGVHPQADGRTFDRFVASELYCPRCRAAVPAREKLLLYLPTGSLYDYLCSRCGTSVGSKKVDN